MDDLLERAVARRAALLAELDIVENFIAGYSRIAEPSAAANSDMPDLFSAPARKGRAARAAAIEAMMDAAEQLMVDAGKPLTRGELVRRLEAGGHKIEGADKSKVLGTNLWRSNRFHNIKGVGYWPKAQPLPAVFQESVIRDSKLS